MILRSPDLVAAGMVAVAAATALSSWSRRVRPAPIDTVIPRHRRGGRRALSVRGAAALAGIAAWVIVGGWFGAASALIVTAVTVRVLDRCETRDSRQARADMAAALPLAADLIAAAVGAGSTTVGAVLVVGDALGGALGDRLQRVAAALSLGAEPGEAWAPLSGVPGASPVVRSAIRTAESGAAWADSVSRAVSALRSEATAAAEGAAQRAGVLLVLPMGLCFLPAFVVLGIVPLVAGVLTAVSR